MNNWSSSWDKPAAIVVAPINPTSSPFPDWDNKSQDEILLEWDKRKKLLTKAKDDEMEFRKYVVQRAFPQPKKGMNNVDLGNGYTLKANIKYNYKLNDNDVVEKGLDELAHTGNDGSFIADRLVSWTPNFLLSEYRVIQEDAEKGSVIAKERLKIIDKFLTVDDAAPSLEIKEPR